MRQEPSTPGASKPGRHNQRRPRPDHPHPRSGFTDPSYRAAVKQLMARRPKWVGGLCRRLGMLEVDAEDRFQDALLRLGTSWKRYDQQRRLEPYFAQILWNLALNDGDARPRLFDAGHSLLQLADGDPMCLALGPVEQVSQREVWTLVCRAIDELPNERDREAARLCLEHLGRSRREIYREVLPSQPIEHRRLFSSVRDAGGWSALTTRAFQRVAAKLQRAGVDSHVVAAAANPRKKGIRKRFAVDRYGADPRTFRHHQARKD